MIEKKGGGVTSSLRHPAGNTNISLHPYFTGRLHLPFLRIPLRTNPPRDLHHMTSPTPAFPRNERNTRSIVFIGYFLAPFIASQGAVAVWSIGSVVGASLWGTDDGRAGLVRARFGGREDSVDGLEEGPETGEAGANDAEREFGVGPDTCGCVVP